MPEPVLYLLLAAAAAALYANSIPGGFICDDRELILASERIHSLRNVPGFFLEPFSQKGAAGGSAVYYRPIVSASFALDWAIWGPGRPWGFHLTNVLAFVICSLLVYALMSRIFSDRVVAWLAALLFAALSVHTETVAWISGRTDLLACVMLLAAFLCLLAARGAGAAEDNRRPSRVGLLYGAGFLFALLAAFAKEVALAILPAWIAFELTLGRKGRLAAPSGRRVTAVMALLAACAVYLAARMTAISSVGAGAGMRIFDPWTPAGMATVACCVLEYLGKLVLPLHLSFGFEVEPFRNLDGILPVLCVLAGAGLIALTIHASVRRPALGFALWWTWLALAPALNFVPINETVAERFLFVPSVGFCILFGLALQDAGVGVRRSSAAGVAAAAMAALILAHAGLTVQRNADWRGERSLYADTVSTAPDLPMAHLLAGQCLVREARGKSDLRLACAQYERARELAEEKPQVLFVACNQLGRINMDLGDMDEALLNLREAVRLDPRHPVPRTSLALVLMQMGQERGLPQGWELGKAEAESVLREHPKHADAYFVLGYWYYEKGDDARRAAEMFGRAAGLSPEFAGAAFMHALALKRAGDKPGAEAALREACRRDPLFFEARQELAFLLFDRGDLDGALREARLALRIGRTQRLQALVRAIEEQLERRGHRD